MCVKFVGSTPDGESVDSNPAGGGADAAGVDGTDCIVHPDAITFCGTVVPVVLRDDVDDEFLRCKPVVAVFGLLD